MNPDVGDVTRLLNQWNAGDADALNAVVAQVYAELRRIAGGLLRQERPATRCSRPRSCTRPTCA